MTAEILLLVVIDVYISLARCNAFWALFSKTKVVFCVRLRIAGYLLLWVMNTQQFVLFMLVMVWQISVGNLPNGLSQDALPPTNDKEPQCALNWWIIISLLFSLIFFLLLFAARCCNTIMIIMMMIERHFGCFSRSVPFGGVYPFFRIAAYCQPSHIRHVYTQIRLEWHIKRFNWLHIAFYAKQKIKKSAVWNVLFASLQIKSLTVKMSCKMVVCTFTKTNKYFNPCVDPGPRHALRTIWNHNRNYWNLYVLKILDV